MPTSQRHTLPFKDLTYVQKVMAATPANATATLSALWEGPTLLGTTLYPSLELVIPYARFDEGIPNVDGPSNLQQTLSGVGLYNGTDSALSIIYKSADTTV